MTDKEGGISIAVKPVLLYFYPTASSFVVQDTQSFQNDYTVKAFSFLTSNKLKLPLSFIRQKLFLFRNISSAAILVCQLSFDVSGAFCKNIPKVMPCGGWGD